MEMLPFPIRQNFIPAIFYALFSYLQSRVAEETLTAKCFHIYRYPDNGISGGANGRPWLACEGKIPCLI
jgi:hypothetical protein